MDRLLNYALYEAVKKNDTDTVRDLLNQYGNSYNHYGFDFDWDEQSLIMDEDQKEIIKMLLQHKEFEIVRYRLLEHIFLAENIEFAEELVILIIKYSDNNIELLSEIFEFLVYFSSFDKCSEHLNVLKILLDHGFKIDDHLDLFIDSLDLDCLTPLQTSIYERIPDFVQLLLDRGADIHKKSKLGKSCFSFVVMYGDNNLVKHFLKKGADVNEKVYKGLTELHMACKYTKDLDHISFLLKYGADVNILNDLGITPIMYTEISEFKVILIKEFAKMTYKDGPDAICKENWEYLMNNKHWLNIFENCQNELQQMHSVKFYNEISLYDIFRMQEYRKMTINLLKNRDLVESFKSCWNPKLYQYYGQELDYDFNESCIRSNFLLSEEKKLHSVFKDRLPYLVICKVVYFSYENLFIKKLDQETSINEPIQE